MIVKGIFHLGVRRFPLACQLNKFDHRFFMLGSKDYRSAGLDDAAFFISNLCQGVTQDRHVVIRNGRDDRDNWIYHVGRVQSAAQPHFQHSHIHLLLAEVQKSQGGSELEGGGVLDDFRQRAEFIGEGNQVHLADPLTIDQDTFTEIDQVWRGVKPNFVTACLQG